MWEAGARGLVRVRGRGRDDMGPPFPSWSRGAARVGRWCSQVGQRGRRVTHLDALAAAAEVGKEHERAPLLLDLAEEVALRAGDEADGLGGHLDDGQVVVLVVVVLDGHRADALRHDALDVLRAQNKKRR